MRVVWLDVRRQGGLVAIQFRFVGGGTLTLLLSLNWVLELHHLLQDIIEGIDE